MNLWGTRAITTASKGTSKSRPWLWYHSKLIFLWYHRYFFCCRGCNSCINLRWFPMVTYAVAPVWWTAGGRSKWHRLVWGHSVRTKRNRKTSPSTSLTGSFCGQHQSCCACRMPTGRSTAPRKGMSTVLPSFSRKLSIGHSRSLLNTSLRKVNISASSSFKPKSSVIVVKGRLLLRAAVN